MSKKILILNGSPRSKGNTAMLCDAFSAGARSAGHQVTRFDLHKLDIHGCLGCVKGGKDPASPCVQKDDMGLIYPAYREADIIVLASPMYYWGFSGQLKTAFDRLFAVAECFPGYANPQKECALIMAAEGLEAGAGLLPRAPGLPRLERPRTGSGRRRVRSRCRSRAACSGSGVPLWGLTVGLSRTVPRFP